MPYDIHTIKSAKLSWQGRALILAWDYQSVGNDRYICVFRQSNNNSYYPVNLIDLRNDMRGTYRIKMDDENSVRKQKFFVYSTPHSGTPDNIDALAAQYNECVMKVVTGFSTVNYKIISRKLDGIQRIKFCINSSSWVEGGILGYSYTIDGKRFFKEELPDAINIGENNTEEFLLPLKCQPKLIQLGGKNINFSIQYKKQSILTREIF